MTPTCIQHHSMIVSTTTTLNRILRFVVLFNLFIFAVLLPLPTFAYTCNGDAVSSTPPTIAEGATVSISGCTFDTHLTIKNPSRVSIAKTSFKRGFTIHGGDLLSGSISIVDAHCAGSVSLQSIHMRQEGQVVNISTLTANSGLRVSNCAFSDGAAFTAVSLTVNHHGVKLNNIFLNSSTMTFKNSKIASATTGVQLQDGQFLGVSQVLFDSCRITSDQTSILFRAENNFTTEKFHSGNQWYMKYTHYAYAFRGTSTFRLVDTNITSTDNIAVQPEETRDKDHFRKVAFIENARFIAVNSQFVGSVAVNTQNQATAILDAASYEGIDLTIKGDDDKRIAIPVPRSISVQSLVFTKCRVYIPDQPVSVPVVWNIAVQVALDGALQLANREQMVVRSTGAANFVRLSSVLATAGSQLCISGGFTYIHVVGSFDGSSILNVTNVRASYVSLYNSKFTGGSSFWMKDSVANNLYLSKTHFTNSSGGRVQNVSVLQYGVTLRGVEVDAATLLLKNTTIASTKQHTSLAGLLIEDGRYTNGAQLIIEDSFVTAKREAILFRAVSNNTNDDRYRQEIYADAFRSGSVMRLHNSVVSSSEAKVAIKSFESDGQRFYRYGRFVDGAAFEAINSQFHGACSLFLVNGAKAVLDAASYEGIDLTIKGDDDRRIAIPVPRSISVQSLVFTKCRVYPLGDELAEATARLHVHVSKKLQLEYIRVATTQLFLLTGGTKHQPAQIQMSSILGGWLQVIVRDATISSLSIAKGTFRNQSGILVDNSTVNYCSLRTLLMESNAVILLQKSSVSMSAGYLRMFGNASLKMSNSVVKGVELYSSVLKSASSVSIVDSTFANPNVLAEYPLFRVTNTVFSHNSSFCIRNTTFEAGCADVDGGAVHFVNWGTGSTRQKAVFVDQSQIVISNSHFNCVTTQQLGAGVPVNLFTNVVGSDSSKYAPIGGTVNPLHTTKSGGVTLILHNTSFQGGRCTLHLNDNSGARVLVDGTTLSRSDLKIHTTKVAATDWSNSPVKMFVPSSFECQALDVKGLRVQWLHDAVLDRLWLNSTDNSSLHGTAPTTPSASPTTTNVSALHIIAVAEALNLQHPLQLELTARAELHVIPSPSFTDYNSAKKQTQTFMNIEGLTLHNESTLVVSNFSTATATLAIQHCEVNGEASSIVVRESSFAGVTIDRTTVSNGGIISVVNVNVHRYRLYFTVLTVTQRSSVVAKNVSTFRQGVGLATSTFDQNSSFVVMDSKLNSLSQGVVIVYNTRFLGPETIFLLTTTTITISPSVIGVGVSFGHNTKAQNGALLIVDNMTISARTTAIQTMSTSFISGTLFLENIVLLNSKQMAVYLHDGGQAVIGKGMSTETALVLQTSSAKTTTLSCSDASGMVCSTAQIQAGSVVTVNNYVSTSRWTTMSRQLRETSHVAVDAFTRKSPSPTQEILAISKERIAGNHVVFLTMIEEFACPNTNPLWVFDEFLHPHQNRDDVPTPTMTRTLTRTASSQRGRIFNASKTVSLQADHLSRTAPLVDVPATSSLSLKADGTSSVSHSRTLHREPEPQSSLPADTIAPSSSPAPTPPPQRRKKVDVTTSVMLPESEAAATVVLSSAGASTALASTLGSGGGGVLVVAGSSLRMMECGLAEDDPRPARFELPLQVEIGNGLMRVFAGTVLLHSLLHSFLFILPIAVRCYQLKGCNGKKSESWLHNKKLVKILSMIFCGMHPFFTPSVLGACSTVLNNDDDTLSLAVAAISALTMITINGFVVVAIHQGPRHGITVVSRLAHHHGPMLVYGMRAKNEFTVRTDDGSKDTSTTSSNSTEEMKSDNDEDVELDDGSSGATSMEREFIGNSTGPPTLLFSGEATMDILLTLFDGCRTFRKASHRHYASIETTLFSIIAIISGSRPQRNCGVAAFVVGGIGFLHLVYVVAVRPFRTVLDMLFAVINSALLVALSLTVAGTLQASESSPPPVWTRKVMEGCLWLISVMGFAQLGVQGYWAYHVAQRRRYLEEQRKDNSGSSSSSGDDSEISDQDADDTTAASHKTAGNELSRPLLRVVYRGQDDDKHGDNNNNDEHDGMNSQETKDNIADCHNPLRNTRRE